MLPLPSEQCSFIVSRVGRWRTNEAWTSRNTDLESVLPAELHSAESKASPFALFDLDKSAGFFGNLLPPGGLKKEIRPMEQASETLYALKPVTFRYKEGIDPQGVSQFGLVAEDVEEVNPDLVVRDKGGKSTPCATTP